MDQKKQYFSVFVGALIGGVCGLGFGSLAPLFPLLIEYYWLGKVGVFIFISFTAYAILKYRLFNIKFIAVEVSVVVLSFFLLGDALFADTISERLLGGGLFAITVVLGFFLSRAVRKEVEQRQRREKVTKDIQQVNKDLELLDQQKTEFVSLASHQLRTPLTAVKGYTSMLLEGSFGELKGDVKTAVNDIFEESETLSRAVEDLLVVSRIEQGRVYYTFEKVDFLALIDSLYQKMRTKVDGEKLKMTLDASKDAFGFVYADQEKLKRALGSVVLNAIEHTEKGFIQLILTRDNARGVMRFSISDTGEGFAEDELENVFERFRDLDVEDAENITQDVQSGVSLYITREFIHAHHGKIWIESSGKNRGSTFFVEIPFYRQTVLADETNKNPLS